MTSPTPALAEAALVASLSLSGIASGALGAATLVGRLGGEDDRTAVRPARRMAFPCMLLAGGLLLVAGDLGWPPLPSRGEPAWPARIRAGVDALSALGIGATWVAFAGLALIAAFRDIAPVGRRRGRIGRWLGLPLDATTVLVAVAMASGLRGTPSLGITSSWMPPLLLGNSASMGLSVLILLAGGRERPPRAAIGRLEALDRGGLVLQGIGLLGFALERGGVERWTLWPAVLIPAFAVPVGWLLPLAVRRLAGPRGSVVAAALALVGAVALRFALVATG